MNPSDKLITTAIRKLPVFKYAIAAAAILALAGIVIKWGINIPTLLLVGGVLLIGAVAFMALHWLSNLKKERVHSMAGFFGWSLLVLLVGSLLAVFTSAVFNKPWSLLSVIEQQIGSKRTANFKSPRTIAFMGHNANTPFMTKWTLEGTATVSGNEIAVSVTSATVRNLTKVPATLLHLQVIVGRPVPQTMAPNDRTREGSDAIPLNKVLAAGEAISLPPFRTVIKTNGDPLDGAWLSFLAFELPPGNLPPGATGRAFIPIHTAPLF